MQINIVKIKKKYAKDSYQFILEKNIQKNIET